MRRTDLVIGILLGLVLGLVVVAVFVFVFSAETVDAPAVDHGATTSPATRSVP